MTTRDASTLIPNTATATEGPLTVSSSAVTLQSLISGGAWHAATDHVYVSVETDQVRISPEGGTPTSTKGHLISTGQAFWLTRGEADVAKVIRVTADAKLQVTQYKNR